MTVLDLRCSLAQIAGILTVIPGLPGRMHETDGTPHLDLSWKCRPRHDQIGRWYYGSRAGIRDSGLNKRNDIRKEMNMSNKAAENLAELESTLKHWQELEVATVDQTTAIMGKTQNPLIRLVMEIIRQDSIMHKRVQQVILDSLQTQAFSLTPEELGEIWEMIEKHAEMERETIALAEKARRNCRLFIQRHLLTYLIEDEKKHDQLLTQLEDFKRKLYPYG
jgi:hypothetical protein